MYIITCKTKCIYTSFVIINAFIVVLVIHMHSNNRKGVFGTDCSLPGIRITWSTYECTLRCVTDTKSEYVHVVYDYCINGVCRTPFRAWYWYTVYMQWQKSTLHIVYTLMPNIILRLLHGYSCVNFCHTLVVFIVTFYSTLERCTTQDTCLRWVNCIYV
jgi:hypothetical protein